MTTTSKTTYEALSKNRWRTVWLLLLFPAMIISISFLAMLMVALVETDADARSLVLAADYLLLISPILTIITTAWVIIALLGGKKMILSFAGAKPIKKADAPDLYRIVENLAIQTGIPTPSVYIIPDESLNAFATGYAPSNSAVAITEGLLKKLSKDELQAVMAHEFGHILHRDTRIMLIAVTMVGIVQLLAELILRVLFRSILNGNRGGSNRKRSGQAVLIAAVIAVVIWLISMFGAIFVQMGISRRREFMADAESAHLTRHPEALIKALHKISADPRVEVLDGKRTIAAMCIADPLEKKQSFFDSLSGLFQTHPKVEERVKALEGLV